MARNGTETDAVEPAIVPAPTTDTALTEAAQGTVGALDTTLNAAVELGRINELEAKYNSLMARIEAGLSLDTHPLKSAVEYDAEGIVLDATEIERRLSTIEHRLGMRNDTGPDTSQTATRLVQNTA